MKLLSFLLFFNKRFMSGFVTTFYPKVYVPELPWRPLRPNSASVTLAHEYIHLHDRKRMGPIFNFLYLFPQILVIFAIFSVHSLWFLLFLVFLLPLPSPSRAWLEFRGYKMSIASYFWITGKKYDIEYVVKHFTTSNYYWMFPFKKYIRNKFKKAWHKIENDQLDPEFREVKDVLRDTSRNL